MAQPVIITRVSHPHTGATLAFEISDSEGDVWIVTTDPTWGGICTGPFPSLGWHEGELLQAQREEIARMEVQ